MLSELSQSEFPEVIRCNRCYQYFSKEYILSHFDSFSDKEIRNALFEKRQLINEKYRKLDEERAEEERKKEANKLARKDKNNPHHRVKTIHKKQTLLFREV